MALTSCFRFDPDRDSNLVDLHVTVNVREAVDATLKLNVFVYNADTLVTSETVIGPVQESYSFLFPRLDKTVPYIVCAFGSCMTGEDSATTDVWSILPIMRHSYLRAERIPHSYGSFDWLGAAEKQLSNLSSEPCVLTLQGLGQPCRLNITGWRETDRYQVLLIDKIRIKIGQQAYPDYETELTPELPSVHPLWLYVFGNPAAMEIALTRVREGVSLTVIQTPENEGGVWTANYSFD